MAIVRPKAISQSPGLLGRDRSGDRIKLLDAPVDLFPTRPHTGKRPIGNERPHLGSHPGMIVRSPCPGQAALVGQSDRRTQ